MSSRDSWIETCALVALWAIAVAFIDPRGEFPLMDDWDFTIPTWNFARTGQFHFTPFTAVSLRAQVLWGAAWTRLFGESFLVLRLSTMTLGAVAIAMTHRILLRAGVARAGRVLGTLALAFHPVFLWASCTYMTEVPFVCASTAAFLLIGRGLAEDRALLLTAGCAAAMVACFVRQTGIVGIVAPLAVVLLLRDEVTARWRRAAVILLAFAALYGVMLLFKRDWLSGSPVEFAKHYKMWHESSFRLPQQLTIAYRFAVFNAQNAALFFLPLVVPLVFREWRRWRLALVAVVAVVLLFRVQHLLNAGYAMPYFFYAPGEELFPGNIFVNFGVGSPTLFDVWNLGLPYPFHLPPWGRLVLTYGSVVAAALLIATVFLALRRARPLLVLSAALAFTGTVALALSGMYIDRYCLDSAWSLGIAITLIVPWEKRVARAAAACTLAAVAIFGVFSVQEYFAWNRARWTAYQSLRARGVPLTDINGGSEPTNWYELSKMNQDQARRLVMYAPPRMYVLAFAPVPGYTVVDRVPFEGWLGWHRAEIKILRKR